MDIKEYVKGNDTASIVRKGAVVVTRYNGSQTVDHHRTEFHARRAFEVGAYMLSWSHGYREVVGFIEMT